MNRTITMSPKRLLSLGLLALLAVVTYGFAAANTVPATVGGDGQSGVTGYAVSNVHYVLDTTNPSNVNQVTFTLAPAMVPGGSIRISVNGTTFITAPCTGTSSVTCNLTGVTAGSLSSLRVVAAQ